MKKSLYSREHMQIDAVDFTPSLDQKTVVVEKIVEVPVESIKIQYVDRIVEVPVEVIKYIDKIIPDEQQEIYSFNEE